MNEFARRFNVQTSSNFSDLPNTEEIRRKSFSFMATMGALPSETVDHALETDRSRLSWRANRTAGAEGTFPIGPENIEGTLPPELRGTMFRTAPGTNKCHQTELKSFFDGDTFISGYSFENGKVLLRCKFIDLPWRNRETMENTMLYSEAGTLPDRPWYPGRGLLDLKNQPSVNIIPWDGRLLALSEGGYPTAVDPQTFEFESRWNFHNTLKSFTMNMKAFTAHPRFDTKTGIGYAFGFVNFKFFFPWQHPMIVYRMETNGKLNTLYNITSLPHYYMVHDMILTENYMVFMVPPVRVTLGGSVFGQRTLLDNFNYTDDDPLRIMILKKDGTSKKPVIIELPPNMAFHNGNGYEEDGNIVLDTLLYEDGRILDVIREWYKDTLPNATDSQLNRIVIDPVKGTLIDRKVISDDHELPRFNMDRSGQKARYLYTVDTGTTAPGDPYGSKIRKTDLNFGTQIVSADHGETRIFGEPVYVPRPGSTEEDDGWILALCFDGEVDKTFMEILDAETLEFIARVWTPTHIPLGFHGNFQADYFLNPDIG